MAFQLSQCLRAARLRIFVLCAIVSATSTFADTPTYLRIALLQFRPDVPPNWTYSITTERDKQQTTERFDPSKNPAGQWTLLQTQDRAPTTEEQEKYFKLKASQVPGPTKATFQRSDIDSSSLKLVAEDSERAEFSGSFQEQSTNSDKMLGHLTIKLVVNKSQTYVEKCTLTLNEPYSPVLGVKMHELVVTTNFSPPAQNRPSLPSSSSSNFTGRIFFIGVEENLSFTYFDFAPAS